MLVTQSEECYADLLEALIKFSKTLQKTLEKLALNLRCSKYTLCESGNKLAKFMKANLPNNYHMIPDHEFL